MLEFAFLWSNFIIFSHLPNVIQICDIMPCTNACCSIQFLLQKLQTLSVLFPPSEPPNRQNPLLSPTRKRRFYEVTKVCFSWKWAYVLLLSGSTAITHGFMIYLIVSYNFKNMILL